jgi:hypothetical protein
MNPDNIADGYDLFTGKVNGPDNHYGEIHTGNEWIPARNHFCGEHPNNMPLALVIFGDKSHLDLHLSLSTLPLTFTLSCFNERLQNICILETSIIHSQSIKWFVIIQKLFQSAWQCSG